MRVLRDRLRTLGEGCRPVTAGFTILTLMAGTLAFAQQAPGKRPNELLVGKLIYVAPMPGNLNGWLMDFLRHWGKYKVTGDSEGVDLVLKGYNPEKEMEMEKRAGVPQPKGEGRRLPRPTPRKEKEGMPVISVSAIDWVTNQPLWHADILDRKQKKDEPAPPLGPETKIYARGLKPEQIAERIASQLQAYVEELEKGGEAKPAAESNPQ